MSNHYHHSPEPVASNTDPMSSITPGQSQNPLYNATLALDLANNKNLLLVIQTGKAAQARRRQHSASIPPPPQELLTPSSIGSERRPTSPPMLQAISDGYQSSDDSLHLPPSSARQRRARANAPFLPPLPGHSAIYVAVDVASAAGAHQHEVVAGPAAALFSNRQQIRRNSSSSNSGSSVSSAFSWQESIFHVRRLPDDAHDAQVCNLPESATRVERGGRSLVPPSRHGSRPHPNPLRANSVFEGGWI